MGITLAYQSINQLRRDIKESRMTITVFGDRWWRLAGIGEECNGCGVSSDQQSHAILVIPVISNSLPEILGYSSEGEVSSWPVSADWPTLSSCGCVISTVYVPWEFITNLGKKATLSFVHFGVCYNPALFILFHDLWVICQRDVVTNFVNMKMSHEGILLQNHDTSQNWGQGNQEIQIYLPY